MLELTSHTRRPSRRMWSLMALLFHSSVPANGANMAGAALPPRCLPQEKVNDVDAKTRTDLSVGISVGR